MILTGGNISTYKRVNESSVTRVGNRHLGDRSRALDSFCTSLCVWHSGAHIAGTLIQ